MLGLRSERRAKRFCAAQPPVDHAFVRTADPRAAAARIGVALGRRKRAELLELLRPCFTRIEPWVQAGKYASAVMCDLRRRNGRTIAERSGDRTPDRTRRLLNRAVWLTNGKVPPSGLKPHDDLLAHFPYLGPQPVGNPLLRRRRWAHPSSAQSSRAGTWELRAWTGS